MWEQQQRPRREEKRERTDPGRELHGAENRGDAWDWEPRPRNFGRRRLHIFTHLLIHIKSSKLKSLLICQASFEYIQYNF